MQHIEIWIAFVYILTLTYGKLSILPHLVT